MIIYIVTWKVTTERFGEKEKLLRRLFSNKKNY